MRIRRVRRGFTTNSSGANEFLPDGGRKITGDSGTPPPVSSSSTAVIESVNSWSATPPPPSQSGPSSNAKTIGVVSLVVAGAFLVVPVVRFLQHKKKKKKGEGEREGERAGEGEREGEGEDDR